MEGNFDALNEMEQQLSEKYKQDKTLIPREMVGHYIYWKAYFKAFQTCINAILLEPYKLINYKTLLYCFKKALLK